MNIINPRSVCNIPQVHCHILYIIILINFSVKFKFIELIIPHKYEKFYILKRKETGKAHY